MTARKAILLLSIAVAVVAKPAVSGGAPFTELDKVLTGTGGAVEVFNRSITAGRSVAVLSVGSEYPRLSEHVVDIITGKLSSGGRYKMIGRPALDAVAKQAFPKGMTVDDQTARWLCKTAGAQTVLVGTILPHGADKAESAAFFNLELKVLDVNSDRPVERFTRKIPRGALEGLLAGDGAGAVAAVDGTATAAKAKVAAAAQKTVVADAAGGKSEGIEYVAPCPDAKTTPVNGEGIGSVACGGETYKTIKIGGQVWMAKNLNYNTKTTGSKCGGTERTLKDENTENCDKYGRLYNWDAAMAVCPSGWHLPSNAEWDALFNFVDNAKDGIGNEISCATGNCYDSYTAGKYLKTTKSWSSGGNGTDAFGFAALPGGVGGSTFGANGDHGFWWSSIEYDGGISYYRYMRNNGDAASWGSNLKSYLFSVRCLQDISTFNNETATAAKAKVAAAAQKTVVADVAAGKSGGSSADDEALRVSTGPLWRQTVKIDYSVRNSADYFGDRYLIEWDPDSQHPSVSTFINEDGTVTVCVSDDNARVAYIYEFSKNLEAQKRLKFNYEFQMFGAFTKDSEGNYYVFYAKQAPDIYAKDANNEPENMAFVKYDKNGNKIKTYKFGPGQSGGHSGVQVPFRTGCRIEISGSMIAVHFARAMLKGDDGSAHQASYDFELNKDTFEPVHDGIMYVSHSFNQFILPINNGFIFADQGDANANRAFDFKKHTHSPSNTSGFLRSFSFAGEGNTTNAQMGGLAKTAGGYIFAGTYGDVLHKRDLFTLTFDEELKNISAPAYLTAYTEENVGHPKIVGIGSGQYLLLWELYKYTREGRTSLNKLSNYLSTKMQIVGEAGNPLSPVKDIGRLRLSMNDVLRYNPKNGRVYWAINDLFDKSFTVYALDAQYAYATGNADLNLPAWNIADGYGLALKAFSTEKNSVLKNEQFSVTVNAQNMSDEQFPGNSQFGAALMDEGGNMVEIIGTKKMSAIDVGWYRGNTIACKVPSTVSPGQYRLRLVIKPDGKDEWRVATMGLNGTPNAIGFTVNQ